MVSELFPWIILWKEIPDCPIREGLCELIQFHNFYFKKLQQVNILICTSYKGYYSGIRALALDHPVGRNLSQNKFAAMSYYEDDYDEQYEE